MRAAKIRFRGFLASGTTSNTQPNAKMHFRVRLGLGSWKYPPDVPSQQHVTHFIVSCLLRCLKKVIGLAMSGASLLDSKAAFKGKVLEYGLPLPVFEGIVRWGVDTLSKAAYAVGAPGVLPSEDALRGFLNPDEPATVEQGQVAIARRLVFEAQTLAVSQLRQQIEGPDEKRQDLQPAERRFRLTEQARRLQGMSLICAVLSSGPSVVTPSSSVCWQQTRFHTWPPIASRLGRMRCNRPSHPRRSSLILLRLSKSGILQS